VKAHCRRLLVHANRENRSPRRHFATCVQHFRVSAIVDRADGRSCAEQFSVQSSERTSARVLGGLPLLQHLRRPVRPILPSDPSVSRLSALSCLAFCGEKYILNHLKQAVMIRCLI
jgi:hypothetical protein